MNNLYIYYIIVKKYSAPMYPQPMMMRGMRGGMRGGFFGGGRGRGMPMRGMGGMRGGHFK